MNVRDLLAVSCNRATWACTLIGNQTDNLLVYRMMPQPSHTSQGWLVSLKSVQGVGWCLAHGKGSVSAVDSLSGPHLPSPAGHGIIQMLVPDSPAR